VSGHPTTDEVFPDQFAFGDGHASFIVSAGLRYDSRDSQHQPYSGFQIGLFVDAPVWQSTGDAGAVGTAFGSVIVPLPSLLHRTGDRGEENPPTDTIALGLTVQASAGTLPFYELPSLGGSDTLRGYIANRFTDNTAWHAVAEYRFWIIPRGFALTDEIRVERIGAALFYEFGTVADRLGKLPTAQIHTSYGVGIRVALDRTALLRADFGFSREDFNVTVGFGLSF
jgi:outer membrane protein assembly factor BamA